MLGKRQISILFLSFVAAIGLTSCAVSSMVLDRISTDASRGKGTRNYDSGAQTVYDVEANHFSLQYEDMLSKYSKANIPTKAIAYALTEFAGIPKGDEYLARMVEASRTGLLEHGYVRVWYESQKDSRMIQLAFHQESKQLEVLLNTNVFSTKVNAVDLSAVDVQVK